MHVGDPAGGRLKFLGCSSAATRRSSELAALEWRQGIGDSWRPPTALPMGWRKVGDADYYVFPCRYTFAVPPLPEAAVSAPLSAMLA